MNDTYFVTEVDVSGLLVAAKSLMARRGVRVRTGPSEGSLGTTGLDYHVVRGEFFPDGQEWGRLQTQMKNAINQVFDVDVEEAERSRAINVNLLMGKGSFYEWHRDGNGYTAVIFLSTDELGGELLLRDPYNDDTLHAIRQRAGVAVGFNGGRVPHAVAPLRGGDRWTLLFSYNEVGVPSTYGTARIYGG